MSPCTDPPVAMAIALALLGFFVAFLILLACLAFGLLRGRPKKEDGGGIGCFRGCAVGFLLLVLGGIGLAVFVVLSLGVATVESTASVARNLPIERVAVLRDAAGIGLGPVGERDPARPLHIIFELREAPFGFDAAEIEGRLAREIADLCDCEARVRSEWRESDAGPRLVLDVALPVQGADLRKLDGWMRDWFPEWAGQQGLLLEFREVRED